MAAYESTNWRPAASLETLKRRAQLIARVRDYFARSGTLEVETPLLSRAGTTDPHLHSFAARSTAPGDKIGGLLHTSPEFAMKRLLAAGSGSIYQICKVFRGGELGRRHNPEFTMLEWYRVGYDHHRLMQDVESLVLHSLDGAIALQPTERLTYSNAFEKHAGIEPHSVTVNDLRNCTRTHGIDAQGLTDDKDEWLNLLLTHIVEPKLGQGRLTFIYDYPASQAALARVRPGTHAVAERFELYLQGIELANGFYELSDADEQRQRFAADRAARKERQLPDIPQDDHLLAALAHGLPECSGVALGIDRLVMLATRASAISEVIAFPTDRA